MRVMLQTAMIGAICCWPTSSGAQSIGVGVLSCGEYISIRREADQERSSPEARELSGQIKESGCTAWVQGYLSAQFQIDRAVQNLTKGRWGGNTYLTFPDGRKELLSRNDTAPTVAARDAYCDTTKDYDPVCLVFDPGVQAVGLLDLGATQTWLDNFCRAKPLERLSTAARELYVEQARRFGALPLVIYSDYQP